MGCRSAKAKPKALGRWRAIRSHLFDEWFAEAREGEPNDAEAMALATATTRGSPSVRMVLLKGHGPDGFVFYTNEQSAKGGQLAANPRAALLFHWKSLRRQVRVEGPGRARVRRSKPTLISPRRAREFAARRLGVGPIAAARQPRDLRRALRRGERAVRRRRTCRGRRTGAAIAWFPSGSNSGATVRTGLHERRLFTRAGGGWSRRTALPMTTREDRRRTFGPLDARSAGQRDARAGPAHRQGVGGLSRPIRPRCSARSPTPRST